MFEPIDRVMNMRKGGSAVAPRRTVIGGQDHMLSYITPQEGEILMSLGGSGNPGPMGIPSFSDGPDTPTFYNVPTGTFGGNQDDMQYKRVYIGSSQDTIANRAAGSADLTNRTQDAGPGYLPMPVDVSSEVAAAINPNFVPDSDSDSVDSDSGSDSVADAVSDPVDPSSFIVPTDEILQNQFGYEISSGGNTYQPFVPDFSIPTSSFDPNTLLGVPLSSLPTGFAQGGAVEAPRRTDIRGQDHMLSYITPKEGEILMALGGSGEPGPMGIPAFIGGDDKGAAAGSGTGDHSGGVGSASGADTVGAADDDMGDVGIGGFTGSYGDDVSSGLGFSTDPTDTMARATEKDYGLDVFGNPPSSGKMGYAGRFGMSPGRSQAMFGVPGFSGLNVGSQQGYNNRMGITDKNPYGKMGLFTSFFGFPTDMVDYSGIMGLNTRRAIANNQFSKFANPQNIRGAPGYNPAFATAKPGQLRAGVQKAGYDTKFGQVVGRNREMSVPEMVARGLFSLAAPGFMSLALSQTGTQEYGLPSLPGMERFGVKDEPPGLVGQMFGALTGGVPADQAFDRAKAAVGDLYGQAKAVVGDLVDSLSPEQIEAVAKATPEQQQEIQENVKSSSTQGFSQPDIFGFSPPSIAAKENLVDIFSMSSKP